MALTDFFRINLPYGIEKKSNNEWFVFNREYLPIGWNSKENQKIIHQAQSEFPIYTRYNGLTEKAILKIIKNPDRIKKNDSGEIVQVFFYNDGTNPQSNPQYWNDYFEIIKAFSKFNSLF